MAQVELKNMYINIGAKTAVKKCEKNERHAGIWSREENEGAAWEDFCVNERIISIKNGDLT
jgi:hypothetical protein